MGLTHGAWERSGSTSFTDQTLVPVLRRFADHDWPWYSRLARAVGDHPPMDLSAIDMPVTYLAGTWDAITSAETNAGRQRADATQSICRTCRHALCAVAVSQPCVSRARRPR